MSTPGCAGGRNIVSKDLPLVDENCVPYRRKSLYLVMTLPFLGVYGVIAFTLGQLSLVYMIIYLVLLALTSLFQSFICVYWDCPYVGRFAPCVAGFCLPASQMARLWKKASLPERVYPLILNMTFMLFLGAILFPVYFLFRIGPVWMLAYLAAAGLYAVGFIRWICPHCATRKICPGGQLAVRLREKRSAEIKH